jgi:hypothetical protein
MQFIDNPIEQTTALTDLLLAIISAAGVIWVFHTGYKVDSKKTFIWIGAFILLTLATLLGSVAHGIKMSSETNQIIWYPLNLFLGLSVALFVAGVVYDLQGFKIQKSVFLIILLASFLFFGITVIYPGLFNVFIIYEAIAMLFSLLAYWYLLIKRKFRGSAYMVLGILISIMASIIQSVESIVVNFIWIFDNNGLFHFFQIPGLFLLFYGLVIEFHSRPSVTP